jgi:hypothetical protein
VLVKEALEHVRGDQRQRHRRRGKLVTRIKLRLKIVLLDTNREWFARNRDALEVKPMKEYAAGKKCNRNIEIGFALKV